jgi:hypothetical protein
MKETTPGKVAQESDAIRARALVAVLLAALVIGFASVGWAGWMLRRELAEIGATRAKGAPAQKVGPTVGMVEQTLILGDGFGRRLNEQQRKTLESYSWVDRSHRLVRIPIERAFDLVLEEKER